MDSRRREELAPLLSSPSPSVPSYYSTDGDSLSGLTSGTHGVQSSNPNPSNSLLVIGSNSQAVPPPRPPASATGQLPRAPDYLGMDLDSSNSAINRTLDSPPPDGSSGQIHGECTEDEGEYPPPEAIVAQRPQNHPRQRENRTAFEILKRKIELNLCLTVSIVILSALCALLVLACIAVPAGLQALCVFYSSEVDVYSNDTVLIKPAFNTFCHSDLLAQEVKTRQGDSTEQQLELYSQSCDDVITFQQEFEENQVNYNNFTGPVPVDTNRHLTRGSNLSVNISAFTYHGETSVVYTCLFDNWELFNKFWESVHDWKKYIPCAVNCQETNVSSAQPLSVKAFSFTIKSPGYYFLGLVSDGVLARLDTVHLYGFREIYVRNDNNRINCTVATESDPPCQVPMLHTGSLPCVLVYAKPPSDIRVGYIGLRLTSGVGWTTSRILSVTIPTSIAVIVIILYLLTLTLFLRKCHY